MPNDTPESRGADLHLNADPSALAADYTSARPFPHAVIDGLFEDSLLDELLAQFPGRDDIPWTAFDSPTEKKLGYHHEARLGERLERFLWQMSSPPVLRFLESLTGIQGLIPDPYFGGAGPHQILPGGFLKVHVDFNLHPLLHLDRRLNLLVYLNRDWREEWGGHLELWEPDMSSCGARILPAFNRTVVFGTTETSFHGHPTPLACPDDRTRKSLSFYYYTAGRPESERAAPHDTIFRETLEP
ncbi:MAG: 2OG-Fe(II) oxygenase [Acidobacteriota bacterium]